MRPKQLGREYSRGDADTRKRKTQRLSELKKDSSSWVSHWRDLTDYIQPWRGRYQTTDRNVGTKRGSKILNSTPRRASRILQSGMMTGITNPAREWFRLTTPDPELAEYGAVREWLHFVEARIRQALARSNLYNCFQEVYADVGTHATAALFIEEDDVKGIRGFVFPVGQFFIATNSREEVDTLYRECAMTVEQCVDKFGLEACSPGVQERFRKDQLWTTVEIIHAVEPRRDRESGRDYGERMPFSSCWFEKAPSVPDWGLLKEGGFEENPAICPRWDATGGDAYGSGSPGMDALGDCKALQLLEKRRLDLVDLTARPPMRGPADLRQGSLVPGAYNAVPRSAGPGQTYEPALAVNPQAIVAVKDAIGDHERRINSSFYADLWLSLLEREGQMTAREVAERHEEKLLQLGPVLTRLGSEFFDPAIDRVFGIMVRRGEVPRPPPELQGIQLRVDYISTLHQAQKLVKVTAVERIASFATGLAQGTQNPAVLDKLNTDEMVDTYAESVGVQPNLIHSDEKVAEIRAARAKQQQAQQQGQAMLAATEGAKNLAGAQLSDDNALSRLMSSMGAAVPQ